MTKSSIRIGVAVAAVASAAACANVAAAQSVDTAQAQTTDLFARDRALSVRDRPRPDYEALGIPLGGFTVFPRAQVDLEHNDNVYAVETGEESDSLVRFRPDVAVQSDWSRHALRFFARGSLSRFKDLKTENTNDWSAGGSGRIDVVRGTSIAAGGDYADLSEPRSASNTAVSAAEPIRFHQASAYLAGSRAAGRLKLSARGDFRTYDYDDGETVGGLPIDQDNRDRDIYSASARIDRALSPATAVFVQVTGNERSYDEDSLATPARDSSGYEVLTGINFELGALSRGEVAVGYISQGYDNVVYSDIDGFGARAQLEWFPTELTTVTASASRTIEDAGVLGSSGFLSTTAGLTVDHELLRNVILTAAVNYSNDDYNGIDRTDERYVASVGGTYLLNRNLGINLSASHLEQSSDGTLPGVNFDTNRLSISLVSQF